MKKTSNLLITVFFIFSSSFIGFANSSTNLSATLSSFADVYTVDQVESETDLNQTEKNIAAAAFDKAKKSGNLTDEFTANNLTQLPIGILENRNSIEYGLVITKARFTPEYALIDVYARIVTPQQGEKNGRKELYFGAQGLKLSYSGGIVGEAKLSMLGDVFIPFNGNEWMLTLEGGSIANKTDGSSYNENTFVITQVSHPLRK